MAVGLRKMTKEEYKSFYRWSVEHQVEELMKERRLSDPAAGGLRVLYDKTTVKTDL